MEYLLVFSFFAIIIGGIVILVEWTSGFKPDGIDGLIILIVGVVIGLFVLSYWYGETSAYKKSLLGKNPYTIVIKYQKINDSTFIPLDTLFIKKLK